ncbi:MAG: hypothetical protein IKH78_06965 [Ruminococcus sp.]|nr:hypothetical protein [Ruminococcus sp.]
MSKKNRKDLPQHPSRTMRAAKAAMLLLSLYFSCAMTVLSGAGLIHNRESYGSALARTGLFMIIAAALMTTGAVLCLFRRDLTGILSIAASVSGLVLCMAMLKKLTGHADAKGWTDKYTLQPVSDMYRSRVLPCIIPVIMAVAIAAIQLCSYEQRKRRSTG